MKWWMAIVGMALVVGCNLGDLADKPVCTSLDLGTCQAEGSTSCCTASAECWYEAADGTRYECSGSDCAQALEDFACDQCNECGGDDTTS